MRLISLFCALSLSFCATNPKSISDQFCDEFLIWADSGPRDKDAGLTRKVHFPNSFGCYETDGDDTVVLTCLAIDWACAENEECADKADKTFRSAAFRYAHYWTEFSYFQHAAKCIGARETIAPNYSDEADLAHSYSVFRKDDRFDLKFDPEDRLTIIEITYDPKK